MTSIETQIARRIDDLDEDENPAASELILSMKAQAAIIMSHNGDPSNDNVQDAVSQIRILSESLQSFVYETGSEIFELCRESIAH